MYTLLIVLIIIAAILMCLIVLIQESKGGGLASSFSASNQIMGVRKTTDVIEKMTWGLAAAIVVLSILSVYFVPNAKGNESVIMQPAMEQKATNANNLPGFGASGQQQNASAQEGAAQQNAPAQQGAPAQQSAAPASQSAAPAAAQQPAQ